MPTDHTERANSARSPRPGGGAALHPILHLVLECARPLAGGLRVALDGVDEVVLGRGETRRVQRTSANGKKVVRVDIPDKRMSADHARLVLSGGTVTLEDTGSTNGTRVNDARIERAALRSGKTFELGQTLFLYSEVEEKIAWRTTDLDCETAPTLPPGLLTLDPLHATKLERLKRVGASGVPVMLLGETGTGKEVLAQAVHALSQRPGPFVAVNCGAIPATLVESQLFGHVKGAFSGAVRDELGVIRSAQFGTLFLDEIGDLPATSQTALLRVLQEGEVMPVGATRAVKVDIRIVCATHQPLQALMERGAFRRDLYGRLAGFTSEIPPLRARRADLGLLVAALLRSRKVRDGESLSFQSDAARALLRYDWPLNVRELEQCLVTSSVLAEEGIVRLEDLPAAVVDAGGAPPSLEEPGGVERDEAIRRELLMRFAEHGGNVSEVARAMGKARQQVQRWVKRFGLDPEAFRR